LIQVINKAGLLDIEPDMFVDDPKRTGTIYDLVAIRMLALISMIIGSIWTHWKDPNSRQHLHAAASNKFCYRLRRTPQAMGGNEGYHNCLSEVCAIITNYSSLELEDFYFEYNRMILHIDYVTYILMRNKSAVWFLKDGGELSRRTYERLNRVKAGERGKAMTLYDFLPEEHFSRLKQQTHVFILPNPCCCLKTLMFTH
jgi:hypothetical protein